MSALGRKIKALREQRGVTQGELATLASVNQAQISQWEKGRRRVPMRAVAKLAAALGEPVDDFVAIAVDDLVSIAFEPHADSEPVRELA